MTIADIGTTGEELLLGLTLNDIEKLDSNFSVWDRSAIVTKLAGLKSKQISKIIIQATLSIVDGFYYAFAATQSKKNFKSFNNWRKKEIRKLNKLNGVKRKNFWDFVSNKSRRL